MFFFHKYHRHLSFILKCILIQILYHKIQTFLIKVHLTSDFTNVLKYILNINIFITNSFNFFFSINYLRNSLKKAKIMQNNRKLPIPPL